MILSLHIGRTYIISALHYSLWRWLHLSLLRRTYQVYPSWPLRHNFYSTKVPHSLCPRIQSLPTPSLYQVPLLAAFLRHHFCPPRSAASNTEHRRTSPISLHGIWVSCSHPCVCTFLKREEHKSRCIHAFVQVCLWTVLCSQCHFIVTEVTKSSTNWCGTCGQPLGPKCVSFCVVPMLRCCHCCYMYGEANPAHCKNTLLLLYTLRHTAPAYIFRCYSRWHVSVGCESISCG